jgi:hypothetical protein
MTLSTWTWWAFLFIISGFVNGDQNIYSTGIRNSWNNKRSLDEKTSSIVVATEKPEIILKHVYAIENKAHRITGMLLLSL